MNCYYLIMIQVWFVIMLSLNAFATDVVHFDACITPLQTKGICKRFTECDSFKQTLDNHLTIEAKFIEDHKLNCTMGLACCELSSNKSSPLARENITLSTISDATTCGLGKLADRVLGGEVVNFGEFPWVVAIEMVSNFNKENRGIRCGGSIVNKRYILTAAHCVVHHEFEPAKVWLGVTNIGPEGNCLTISTNKPYCINSTIKMNIEAALPHPLYGGSRDHSNDIGLLRVDKNIEITEYTRPLCLPPQDANIPPIGSMLTVVGWGKTELTGDISNILMTVDLPVRDNSLCNNVVKSRQSPEITSRQLCVGGELGKDSCHGDSGSPLMKKFTNINGDVQWYQEGIVSFGIGCGFDKRPAIYTRVSSYVRWISNTIENLQVNLEKDGPCTTPKGTVGTCVPLSTCKEVFNAASTKNQDGYFYAIEAKCGFNNEQLVCCQSPGSIILPNFDSKALPEKTTCGEVKDRPRIYGGEVADLGEFPWAVAIEFTSRRTNKTGEYRCTGSVINKRYVLTSAKCLTHSEFEPVSVLVGEWNITSDPDCKKFVATVDCADPVQKIPIKETIPHIFYSGVENRNNIGLILLENEIKYSDYVAPICLPPTNLPPLELGTRMTVIGWGKTEATSKPDTLRKVEIPLVSNARCNQIFEKTEVTKMKVISSQQLCAGGERGKDSCTGDGGGPLMRIGEDSGSGRMQWYLEGLTAYGFACGRRPAVYTKVSSYTNWIINIISED